MQAGEVEDLRLRGLLAAQILRQVLLIGKSPWRAVHAGCAGGIEYIGPLETDLILHLPQVGDLPAAPARLGHQGKDGFLNSHALPRWS